MTAALAALALLAPGASGPQTFAVDPARSAVRYHVNHKLHKVDAVSKAVEGKAILDADGKVRTMVRIPVQSFDSGDANRDSHMLETLEAGRFPHVVFKGVASLPVPVPEGKPLQVTFRGELDFHGVARAVEVPVTIEMGKDGSARVRGKMTVSLDAHRIERPALLLVKVDDECAIDLDLGLGRSGS